MSEHPPATTPPTLEQRRQGLIHAIERFKMQLFAAQGALALVEELMVQESTRGQPVP